MDHKACWLIDHHKFAIFTDNIKRNILGLYFIFISRMVKKQCNYIEWFYTIIAFYRLLVDMNKTGLSCQLNTIARSIGQMNH